jgi:hypothetical protein
LLEHTWNGPQENVEPTLMLNPPRGDHDEFGGLSSPASSNRERIDVGKSNPWRNHGDRCVGRFITFDGGTTRSLGDCDVPIEATVEHSMSTSRGVSNKAAPSRRCGLNKVLRPHKESP